jgi:heterodisulfide reductase subunit A
VPSRGLSELAEKLRVSLGEDYFVLERHPKLSPVNTLREGIFACGCVLGPKDIRDSVSEAGNAASKVNEFLCTGEVSVSPEKISIDELKCDGCGTCEKKCPVDAITFEGGKAKVDIFACDGCGACVPECPKDAIVLKNSTEKQLLSQIKGAFEFKTDKPVVLAFLDNETSYAAADMIGLSRITYPPTIRIIRVPSSARIGLKHILYAFGHGADGVLLIEGAKGSGSCFKACEITGDRIREYKRSLRGYGIEPLRLAFSEIFIPSFRKLAELFSTFVSILNEKGKINEDVRTKIRKDLPIEYE